jgi:choline dehydrogenase
MGKDKGCDAAVFDYIVVGGGSAGCAVAARLAEDPNCSVLLLEAGGAGRSPLIKIPGGVRMTIGNPKFDWMLVSEPDPTRDNRRDSWNRGKVLGGSSAINGMVYHRGAAYDYDSLARDGMPGWSWNDVLPYFMMSEDFEGPASPVHGKGGPLGVSFHRTPHLLSTAFLKACAEASLPVINDLNGGASDGVGLVHCTQRNGARDSAAEAFLRRPGKRRNLSIWTECHTDRIMLADGRAEGVAFTRRGVPTTALARREIILAAGSIMSPHILMHSGIGPGAALTRLGLPVLVDRDAVGANFHDHLDVSLKYEVNQATFNMKIDPYNMLKYGVRWLIRRDGPVASPGVQICGLLRSSPDLDRADIYFYFQPNGYRVEPGKIVFNREPTVTFFAGTANPKSRGEVVLASPDPRDLPLIRPRMMEAEADRQAVLAGLHLGRRLMSGNAMKPYIVQELEPGMNVQDDDALLAHARATSDPMMHSTGTCRMGTDEASVVDPTLRVRGVRGLRIADMSIVPRVPSANTNAVAIMIGERCADFIKRGVVANQ